MVEESFGKTFPFENRDISNVEALKKNFAADFGITWCCLFFNDKNNKDG